MQPSSVDLSYLPFELASLSKAQNYQKWIADSIMPFMGRRILEVGAGIGNMSKWLPLRDRLILTEVEDRFIPELNRTVVERFGASPLVSVISMDLLKKDERQIAMENLDTIVSFNVLEHIDKDAEAIAQLVNLLEASKAEGPKRLVTLVPAHGWAYGTMDKEFGHYRRYSISDFKTLLKNIAPQWRMEARYFNVFGLPSWVVMGRVLKKKTFGLGAISGFEAICPYIRSIDDFLHKTIKLPFGQSLMCVWEK